MCRGGASLFGPEGSREAYSKAILVLVVPQFIVFLMFAGDPMSRKEKVPGM